MVIKWTHGIQEKNHFYDRENLVLTLVATVNYFVFLARIRSEATFFTWSLTADWLHWFSFRFKICVILWSYHLFSPSSDDRDDEKC